MREFLMFTGLIIAGPIAVIIIYFFLFLLRELFLSIEKRTVKRIIRIVEESKT